ncbi:zinc ribbon domain-containing protein YjdM [Colwellia psychrerythraea]|uniref:Alkylphosphonate utilization operon protein PhnA n=1 Tax=Colwellia psychrerythraea TaxID=28229 RepID=A0A099L1W1_COLPS|nr:zinc ribbon domain-containing protein YjdM [Colwellia psychrerythraea]KGJ96846.1 alkylphosphonate utilization operon protein PhnA [Colwellia psychrerythraea]
MSETIPPCPKCQSVYVYQDQSLFICPECHCEWDPTEVDDEIIVKDVNGNILAVGDKLTLVKDLKVKGSSMVLKIGSKATIKRLLAGDHPLDCKVTGYGDMLIKADKVKKA